MDTYTQLFDLQLKSKLVGHCNINEKSLIHVIHYKN